MPKKDNFSAQMKATSKASKKVADEKARQAKEEEAAAAAAVAFEATQKEKKELKVTTSLANTTFAKAAVAGDSDDDDGDQYSAPTTTTTSAKDKKESNNDKRKKEAQKRKDDAAFLKDQQRSDVLNRVKERFLQATLVSSVMDLVGGSSDGEKASKGGKKEAPDSGAKKQKKKGGNDMDSGRSKGGLSQYASYVMPALAFMAVMYGKAMEDLRGSGDMMEENLYDVMELSRGADMSEVRKQYKSLAITLHPDKNPDCAECPEKFSRISKAYDVLSNAASKNEYDTKSTTTKGIKSDQSIDLGSDDFEEKVLRSNEVWIIQVYEPNDGASGQYAPIWEEVATKHKKHANFGRVNIKDHPRIMEYLPTRVKITPVFYRFARGEEPEIWTPPQAQHGSEADSIEASYGKSFRNFLADSFPIVSEHLEDTSAVSSFWASTGRARLIVGAKTEAINRGVLDKDFFGVIREAFRWGDLVRCGAAARKHVREGLQPAGVKIPQAKVETADPFTITYIPAGESAGDKAVTVWTSDPKELQKKVKEAVYKGLKAEAPQLTVRSSKQLCSPADEGRTLCLVLVDMSDSEVAKTIKELRTSEAEYAKEVAENRAAQDGEESSDAVKDEEFRIQAVRVSTSTSYFPSQNYAVPSGFYTAWDVVGRSQMFLLESESAKVAAVKPGIVNGVFQAVAYEDLKLKNLPEDFNVQTIIPDPEVPLKRALLRTVTSPLGAIFTWLLGAAAYAIAPELSTPESVVAGSAALAVVLGVWPLACRRLLGIVLGGY